MSYLFGLTLLSDMFPTRIRISIYFSRISAENYVVACRRPTESKVRSMYTLWRVASDEVTQFLEVRCLETLNVSLWRTTCDSEMQEPFQVYFTPTMLQFSVNWVSFGCCMLWTKLTFERTLTEILSFGLVSYHISMCLVLRIYRLHAIILPIRLFAAKTIYSISM